MARRDFGSVRRLPSGRWQATWKREAREFAAPETFRTKTDATQYLAAVRADIERGTFTDPEGGRLTVKTVAAKWLESNPNKSPASLARDDSILGCHVLPKLGDRTIGSVKANDIQTLVNSWKGAASTVGRQYTCLAAVFSYAVDQEWLPKSPCRKINLPTVGTTKRYVLKPEDIANIVSASTERLRPAVLIGANTGMRWGEVFALRFENVNLRGKVLTVAGGITRTAKGAPVLGRPGTSHKAQSRDVPIGNLLTAVLASHVKDLGPGDLLFPDAKGGLMRSSNWRRREWVPALETAGLAEIKPLPGFHDLRRLNATQLAGVTDVKTMMERLGIRTERVALGIYAQAVEQRERDAADAMEAFSMSHVGRTKSKRKSA